MRSAFVHSALALVVASSTGCFFDGLGTGTEGGGGDDATTTSTASTSTASTTTASTTAASTTSASTTGGGGGGTSGTGGSGGGAGCDVGHECVAEADAGEYVRVALGSQPACPAGWISPQQYGDGAQPGCTACSCDAPTGVCTPGGVNGYGGPNCTNVFGVIFLATNECYDLQNTNTALRLQASVESQTECAPGASTPVALPVRTVCRSEVPPAMPCGTGGVCVPVGDAAFTQMCNLLPAGSSCAPGWSTPTNVAAVLGDDRVCVCGCGSAVGEGCAGGSVSYWSDNNDNCNGAPLGSVPANNTCTGLSQNTDGSIRINPGAIAGGSCPPSQIGSGSVSFAPPETLCCIP